MHQQCCQKSIRVKGPTRPNILLDHSFCRLDPSFSPLVTVWVVGTRSAMIHPEDLQELSHLLTRVDSRSIAANLIHYSEGGHISPQLSHQLLAVALLCLVNR